jgi:serine/threonine-protein kinase
MDAARWRRLRELVEEAGDLPPGEREAAVRRACGDDESLLADARSLLQLDGQGEAGLDAIVADAVSNLIGGVAAGARVGAYRIVREIGQGGMGAVYLAERADGQFEQRVALKLVKPGLTTAEFLRRFRAERQILARLQHPHIARLLDGGVDDAGRPYFALEHVEGVPIDRYCALHGLGVDERLALFLDVCVAVAYAHANLVVHRDLKPAHVLVTDDRQVRLLDFGIAKMLGEEEAGAGLTELGIRALTPEYASPEQVRGEQAGTATDVYSLGVILYELLTGARPYEIAGRSPAEVERVVCGVTPVRPSTRGTAAASGSAADARLRRRLRGDLDVICLKALHKDPARRYSSVEALAEDLRRHLAGLPVLARPDAVGYRVGRFVSRHRLGVATAAACTVALAGLIGVHTLRLADERDRARQEAAKAEQVATFLRGLFEVSDPSTARGRAVTARELLDEGAARIDRELASQPEVRASMMRVIGEVYDSLGLFDEAKALLERALAEHRRLYGGDHDEVATNEIALGVVLQNLGDVDGAERLMRSGLATRERLHGGSHEKVSEGLRRLAFLLETRGQPEPAAALFRRALDVDRALFPPDHPRVAKATAELAGLLRRQQRLDEAEPLLRDALAAQRRAYGTRDLAVASTIRNLASLLRDRGALDEADALYREAIAIRRTILGDLHPDVANALNSHALLLDRTGDHDGAAAAYREAIRISEHMYEGEPHPDLAATYNNLAGTLRALGRVEDAADMFRKSMAIGDQVLDAGHPNRAFARIGLAGVYLDQDRFADAEPLIRDALALRRGGLSPGHRYIGDALVALGECLTGLRRFADAEGALLDAQRLFVAAGDDARRERAERRLDALHAAWGRPDRAIRVRSPG